MRLIDADALEKDLRGYADRKCYNGEVELANGILKGVGRIKLAPTIDPVRHGRWEKIEPQAAMRLFDVKCASCESMGFKSDKYCANCGAKMDMDELNACECALYALERIIGNDQDL